MPPDYRKGAGSKIPLYNYKDIIKSSNSKNKVDSILPTQGRKTKKGNMILVRKDVPFTVHDVSSEINALAVQIKLEEIITICSIYLNPNNNIDLEKLNDLVKKLPQPFLLIGDFNARHLSWHDVKSNPRGNIILDFIIDNQLHILDENKPTHFDQRTKSYSHIDLSLCSQDLADKYFWNTYDDLCGSDHFPVLINILNFTGEVAINKFYVNKANWGDFGECTKNVPIWDDNLDIETILVMFLILVIDAAESSMPFVSHVKIKCPVPWWNEECKKAKKARNKAQRKFKKSRNDSDYIEYKRSCAVAKRTFNEAQRKSWCNYLKSVCKDTPLRKIWKKCIKY
ncbi:uncharacterized protein [Macrobrachium rosenbergii]|uniref:uncharacterized protein n=1 Tax=Macrobrachium rosenbergii TaxID=79674 RepID=UPI0034D606D3